MNETEECRIWERDTAELRRSEVYPTLLRPRTTLRWQTPADRMLLTWVERVLRSLDTSAPWG